MNNEELNQRMVELIAKAKLSMRGKSGLSSDLARNYYIAEALIANGVTIREHGEWKDNIFCTRCGYAAEDDEGHILMSFDDFCSHCGSDMRGEKDE